MQSKEYPWHPSYKDIVNWIEPDKEWLEPIMINHHVPVSQYEWESGSNDRSVDEAISLYLPSKLLIDELKLSSKPDVPGTRIDEYGHLAFTDLSVNELGPSYALIRYDLLEDWLEENDLQLVWVVGGEKMLFTSRADKFYGRLVYSGIFTKTPEGIDGDVWFIEEHGRD